MLESTDLQRLSDVLEELHSYQLAALKFGELPPDDLAQAEALLAELRQLAKTLEGTPQEPAAVELIQSSAALRAATRGLIYPVGRYSARAQVVEILRAARAGT